MSGPPRTAMASRGTVAVRGSVSSRLFVKLDFVAVRVCNVDRAPVDSVVQALEKSSAAFFEARRERFDSAHAKSHVIDLRRFFRTAGGERDALQERHERAAVGERL